MKRCLSLFLAVIMLFSVFSGLTLSVSAETADLGVTERVVDPSTIDGWKTHIGIDHMSTMNAGAVWMDKSVFTDTSVFKQMGIKTSVRGYDVGMVDEDNNMLVALSAIASNKSIVGYAHIPTDTMLVLDVSASMSDNNVRTMIAAANAAISKL